jgi:hypothetical protein
LAFILAVFLAFFWHSIWLSILALYLAFILTFSLAWALPDLNCERQISEKATSPFEVVDGHEPKPETKCIFRDDEKTRRLDMEAGNWQ